MTSLAPKATTRLVELETTAASRARDADASRALDIIFLSYYSTTHDDGHSLNLLLAFNNDNDG